MRFTDKRFLDVRDVGRTRTIKKFLWFPLSIGNETRWLEKVTYQEIVELYSREYKIYKWVPQRWVD